MSKYSAQERLDVTTAPEAEKELLALVENTEGTLECDFTNTEYISSAGLRVMLVITKKLKSAGREFVLTNMQPIVKEVFELSGLDAFMTIQD